VSRRDQRERPAHRLPRLVWPLAVAVTVGGMIFVFFLPARALMQQRSDLRATETRLAVLSAQNQRLTARVAELHTDAEIQRLARQQYGLVFPGEEAYAILPSPQPPAPAAPAARPRAHRSGLPSRLWHDLANMM
jgi:cell division protein FtsB